MFEQLIKIIKSDIAKNNALKLDIHFLTKNHKNHAIIFTINNSGFIMYDDGSWGLADSLRMNND